MATRSLFNDENCDVRKSTRIRVVSMAREVLEIEEVWKHSAVPIMRGVRVTIVSPRDSVQVWTLRV